MKAMGWFLFGSLSLHAGTINLGVLSFDAIQPGLNVFTIANYTGDPSLGGFALAPPDFPVYSMVTLQASSLTVYQGSASQLILLGDIAPGTFTSSALEFPDTAQISLAVFTATLSRTLLSLADNSTRLVVSDISIALLPANGLSLSGGDLAVITADEVPEPGSGLLCVGGFLLGAWILRRIQATV